MGNIVIVNDKIKRMKDRIWIDEWKGLNSDFRRGVWKIVNISK